MKKKMEEKDKESISISISICPFCRKASPNLLLGFESEVKVDCKYREGEIFYMGGI